jgi:hypothetical protein
MNAKVPLLSLFKLFEFLEVTTGDSLMALPEKLTGNNLPRLRDARSIPGSRCFRLYRGSLSDETPTTAFAVKFNNKTENLYRNFSCELSHSEA